MKKILNSAFVLIACCFLVIGCNSKKNNDTSESTGGSPSDAVSDKMATDNIASNTIEANKDTTTVISGTGAIKTNPAKKGKKVIISIAAADKKTAGNDEATDAEGYYINIYPEYPGGDKALEKFFEKNIQYPAEASDNGVEGNVNISFTVDEKGKVALAKTTNPKIGYGIEEEALRVFKKMPVWKPGALKGKNVKTRYNLPVRFQLES